MRESKFLKLPHCVLSLLKYFVKSWIVIKEIFRVKKEDFYLIEEKDQSSNFPAFPWNFSSKQKSAVQQQWQKRLWKKLFLVASVDWRPGMKIENTVIPRKIFFNANLRFFLGTLPKNCLCQLLGLLQPYHFSGSGSFSRNFCIGMVLKNVKF